MVTWKWSRRCAGLLCYALIIGDASADVRAQAITGHQEQVSVQVVDSQGLPVEGAVIHLFAPKNPLYLGQSASRSRAIKETTNANGIALLPGMLPEKAGVYATKDRQGAVLQTSLDGKTSQVQLVLNSYGSVGGAVYNGDTPEANKTVTLSRQKTEQLTVNYAVKTDQSGQFRFTEIPAGKYTMAATQRYDNLTALENRTIVDIKPGENRPVLLGGVGGTRLYGSITTDNGQPLSGATIRLHAQGQTYETYSDSSGHYGINEVPPGPIVLSAQVMRPGKDPYYGSERLELPDTLSYEKNLGISLKISLAPGVTISGIRGKVHGTTVTLEENAHSRILLLMPFNASTTTTRSKLSTVSQHADALKSRDMDLMALAFAGQYNAAMDELIKMHPDITFLFPEEEWLGEFVRRYPSYKDVLGVVVNRSGKILQIINDEELLVKLSEEKE